MLHFTPADAAQPPFPGHGNLSSEDDLLLVKTTTAREELDRHGAGVVRFGKHADECLKQRLPFKLGLTEEDFCDRRLRLSLPSVLEYVSIGRRLMPDQVEGRNHGRGTLLVIIKADGPYIQPLIDMGSGHTIRLIEHTCGLLRRCPDTARGLEVIEWKLAKGKEPDWLAELEPIPDLSAPACARKIRGAADNIALWGRLYLKRMDEGERLDETKETETLNKIDLAETVMGDVRDRMEKKPPKGGGPQGGPGAPGGQGTRPNQRNIRRPPGARNQTNGETTEMTARPVDPGPESAPEKAKPGTPEAPEGTGRAGEEEAQAGEGVARPAAEEARPAEGIGNTGEDDETQGKAAAEEDETKDRGDEEALVVKPAEEVVPQKDAAPAGPTAEVVPQKDAEDPGTAGTGSGTDGPDPLDCLVEAIRTCLGEPEQQQIQQEIFRVLTCEPPVSVAKRLNVHFKALRQAPGVDRASFDHWVRGVSDTTFLTRWPAAFDFFMRAQLPGHRMALHLLATFDIPEELARQVKEACQQMPLFELPADVSPDALGPEGRELMLELQTVMKLSQMVLERFQKEPMTFVAQRQPLTEACRLERALFELIKSLGGKLPPLPGQKPKVPII